MLRVKYLLQKYYKKDEFITRKYNKKFEIYLSISINKQKINKSIKFTYKTKRKGRHLDRHRPFLIKAIMD